VRPGVIAALGLVASTARAEPRLEASAFVGIDYFGDHTELGNSWAPEQVPGTSPVLGARLSYLAIPRLTERLPLQLAIEGELAVAPAFTGGSSFGDGGRMSYFAPVFGWRAHAALRLAKWTGATPFLVVGGGGATVASSSPFMSKESDPVVYYGPGVSIPVSGSWQFRIDLRHGIMPARESGATSTFEVQLGVSTTFGLPKKRIAAPVVEPPPPQPEVDEHDTDGDGLADRLDSCPKEP
jgi:hypothetical protein